MDTCRIIYKGEKFEDVHAYDTVFLESQICKKYCHYLNEKTWNKASDRLKSDAIEAFKKKHNVGERVKRLTYLANNDNDKTFEEGTITNVNDEEQEICIEWDGGEVSQNLCVVYDDSQ